MILVKWISHVTIKCKSLPKLHSRALYSQLVMSTLHTFTCKPDFHFSHCVCVCVCMGQVYGILHVVGLKDGDGGTF